jgi:uncharacterized membrane protein
MTFSLKKYKHELILGILIFIYVLYFAFATFYKQDNFYTGRYDLGNMDQTVWNTINGRIFQTSTENGSTISRLSVHADFILILLSPFYLLWSNPKTLLLIQTFILAFGSIFVFLIAKEILKNKNFALIFGFLLLMNPLLQFTNLYDFHAVALASTFLLASFYFLIRKRYFLMTFFLIFSGICKEQIWIITSIFGFPLLFQKDKKIKILGILIVLFSSSVFLYLIRYAIPQSLGSQHFALAYYSDFGNSPLQVISNIIISPQKTVPIIFETSRLEYLKQIFLPMGFISIFSPIFLIFAVPDLLINLLSNNSGLRQIYYQYNATINPFIFISSIFAVKKISKWFPKISRYYIMLYLLFFTLYSAYLFGPLPGTRNPGIDMFIKPQKNKVAIENILAKIPQKYTVATTNNLGSHLSHRKIIYTIPVGIDRADVLAFLLNDRFAQPSLDAQKDMVKKLKLDKNYIKVFEKDDFVVFKKLGVLL